MLNQTPGVSPETAIAEELIPLIRGFFAVPVVSAFGKLGVLDQILPGAPFTAADFPKITNKPFLSDGLRYLTRIGLLEPAGENPEAWKTTELGKQIFQRTSSFYVPHSYHEYMENYFRALGEPPEGQASKVDRLENIIGSGKTHQRYVFPAVSFLKRRVTFEGIVDIGCGDGQFLEAVLKNCPVKRAAGVDLSEVSVKTARENLGRKYPDLEIKAMACDASDVSRWAREILDFSPGGTWAISMWFLLHEISGSDPASVIGFLTRIHEFFPRAPLVIGEIVRQEEALLAANRKESLMPEYLFFHELSRQGVLSWEEYRRILECIPYQLHTERLFDVLTDAQGKQQPSSFLWCLVPK